MRIGILTFHRSYNYGAFLQCYSLVQQLKKDFPQDTVEVIDYMFDDNEGYKRALENASKNEQEVLLKRNASIESVISCLPLSKKRVIDGDYQKLYQQIAEDYDVIVVGSDAVFNWNGKGLPNAFMPVDISFPGKIVSYAASSHGIDYLKSSPETLKYAGEAFKGFAFLGVRDETTAELVKAVAAGAEPVHNCDPTVLLDLEKLPVDMDQLKEKLTRRGIRLDKPIVGIMAGDHVGKDIRKIAGKDVQVVSVYRPNKYADFFLDDLNPFEWARVFSLFDVTVTHFFHGTMFSLKNGTPTIVPERVSAYQSKYLTKVKDLLTRLDLLEFYFPCKIGSRNLLGKVLYKLGLSGGGYCKKLNKRILEYLTNGLPENYISDRLDRERASYKPFREYMQSLE